MCVTWRSGWFYGMLVCGLSVLYLLFFHRLADRDLWSSHEARAAMNAQTLLDSGDWLLPRLFDGTPELQKPPLYYWLVATLAWLRGGLVDAWSVRLPSALAALGCLAVVGLIPRRRTEGLLAGLVLATALHFTWLARIGRIDIPLTLTTSVAILVFSARPTRSAAPLRGSTWRLIRILGYFSLAAGLLLKGPIGLVLPVAVLLVLAMVERRWTLPGWWWGLPLVGLLTVPWYWAVNVRTDGEFFRVFLWYHNVSRGLGGSLLRTHPWWFYGLELLRGLLPWSLLLPAALWWARRRWWRCATTRLGLVWLLTVLAVLSCARFKRADYLLPAYPGAALFLAGVLVRWKRYYPTTRLVWGAVCLCSVAWLVHVEIVLPSFEPARDWKPFAAAIRSRAPGSQEVILFRTETHALAFHLGRPLTILVEWHDLADRLARPGRHHVVMPPEWLDEARQRLLGLDIEEELRKTTPALVLLRTRAIREPSFLIPSE